MHSRSHTPSEAPTHGNRIDQSRIDRFYLNNSGFWIHAIHRLEHIQDQTLLDHNPIILTIQIAPQNSTSILKKSTYFEANPSILKRVGTMEALRAAWIAYPPSVSDPTHKFTFAWICLRKTLKTIQEQVIATDQPLDILLSQLVQLKMDILDKSNHQQRHDHEQVHKQIRETELQEANRLRSLSRVRWMGIGDETYRTFFILVQAKQQRETMLILLTDEDDTIEDEGKIIEEVGCFYTKLCTSEGSSPEVLAAREELLGYVSICVTEDQSRKIEAVPTGEEV